MKPKKVGIITISRADNYGAELQAYAMQAILNQLGYNAEIIDYLYYKNKRHKATKMSKPLFHMPLITHAKELLFPYVQILKQLKQDRKIAQLRAYNFEYFHRKNTKYSPEYRTYDSLFQSKLDYDVYIVGSDQVWNPNSYTSLDPYFLRFAPKGKRKISYASSIGISALPKHTHDYFRKAWNSLDTISVREDQAKVLVKYVSGRDATVVLDPTLLLDSNHWGKLAEPINGIPTNFVLIYDLIYTPYGIDLAKRIAKKMNIPVVRITKGAFAPDKELEIINVMDAGPAEFIWLFKNAQFVITTSFHGAAYSINMNKQFYTIIRPTSNKNSRQLSLLQLVGLPNRILNEGTQIDEDNLDIIDYTHINENIKNERNNSIMYLKHAINGEK